jgi:glycosyltransferase involved in cell wall biosynthesis
MGEGPIIISLRNLEPVYDIQSLIKAVPQVLAEFPSATFVVGGTGSEEERLKLLSRSLGVSERVRFIGAYRNDDLPDYLRLADVYVSTSLSDAGISASTAEAMACGIPVIVTDTGDNRGWVESGCNGLVIRVGSPMVLSRAITDLLKDKQLSDAFKLAGRRTIEERNSYLKEMEKMEEFYVDLARRSNYS